MPGCPRFLASPFCLSSETSSGNFNGICFWTRFRFPVQANRRVLYSVWAIISGSSCDVGQAAHGSFSIEQGIQDPVSRIRRLSDPTTIHCDPLRCFHLHHKYNRPHLWLAQQRRCSLGLAPSDAHVSTADRLRPLRCSSDSSVALTPSTVRYGHLARQIRGLFRSWLSHAT